MQIDGKSRNLMLLRKLVKLKWSNQLFFGTGTSSGSISLKNFLSLVILHLLFRLFHILSSTFCQFDNLNSFCSIFGYYALAFLLAMFCPFNILQFLCCAIRYLPISKSCNFDILYLIYFAFDILSLRFLAFYILKFHIMSKTWSIPFSLG